MKSIENSKTPQKDKDKNVWDNLLQVKAPSEKVARRATSVTEVVSIAPEAAANACPTMSISILCASIVRYLNFFKKLKFANICISNFIQPFIPENMAATIIDSVAIRILDRFVLTEFVNVQAV